MGTAWSSHIAPPDDENGLRDVEPSGVGSSSRRVPLRSTLAPRLTGRFGGRSFGYRPRSCEGRLLGQLDPAVAEADDLLGASLGRHSLPLRIRPRLDRAIPLHARAPSRLPATPPPSLLCSGRY